MCFSRNWPIFFCFQIYLNLCRRVFHSVLLLSTGHPFAVSGMMSLVLLLILVVCVFYISMSVWLEVCHFHWSFGKPTTYLTDFPDCFSFKFLLLSLLFSFLCLHWVYFAFLFLGLWEGSLDYWFETFSLFFNAYI